MPTYKVLVTETKLLFVNATDETEAENKVNEVYAMKDDDVIAWQGELNYMGDTTDEALEIQVIGIEGEE